MAPVSPKTKRIRELEKGLREMRTIAFERAEQVTSLTTEVTQLNERVEVAEAQVQAAQDSAQLAADARIETLGRLAGQRVMFLGGLWPDAREVFGDELQPGVRHTGSRGPAVRRSAQSTEYLREAVDSTRQWLPESVQPLWGQEKFQNWVMDGTRRLSAVTLNFATSHGNDVFGIPGPGFKDPNSRKSLPAVRALINNSAFLFGDGVDLNDDHSVVCMHGRNHCTRNILRYILRGATYVVLGRRNAQAKPSRAAMWQLTATTPPMLALAATLAYHILLGHRTFYLQNGGANYIDFYQRRLEFLSIQQQRSPKEYASLLEWLDNDLFPPAPALEHNDNEDVDMEVGDRRLMESLDDWVYVEADEDASGDDEEMVD